MDKSDIPEEKVAIVAVTEDAMYMLKAITDFARVKSSRRRVVSNFEAWPEEQDEHEGRITLRKWRGGWHETAKITVFLLPLSKSEHERSLHVRIGKPRHRKDFSCRKSAVVLRRKLTPEKAKLAAAQILGAAIKEVKDSLHLR